MKSLLLIHFISFLLIFTRVHLDAVRQIARFFLNLFSARNMFSSFPFKASYWQSVWKIVSLAQQNFVSKKNGVIIMTNNLIFLLDPVTCILYITYFFVEHNFIDYFPNTLYTLHVYVIIIDLCCHFQEKCNWFDCKIIFITFVNVVW